MRNFETIPNRYFFFFAFTVLLLILPRIWTKSVEIIFLHCNDNIGNLEAATQPFYIYFRSISIYVEISINDKTRMIWIILPNFDNAMDSINKFQVVWFCAVYLPSICFNKNTFRRNTFNFVSIGKAEVNFWHYSIKWSASRKNICPMTFWEIQVSLAQ